jgi:ABC-type multidrug transport system ATPase subunit
MSCSDFHFSTERKDRRSLSNEAINEEPSATYGHLPIRQFSSGMLQRVKLALAFFTRERHLVLLDEPTETLDEHWISTLHDILLESYSSQAHHHHS